MFEIKIPDIEEYDEIEQKFVYIKERILKLEHSLYSISKWESKWHKPFLSSEKTNDELLDYVRCMNVLDDDPIEYIPNQIIEMINDYINDSMTATWFNDRDQKSPSREIITSELIYYWMIAYQIPFECEHWHLNRLLTLIRVCSIKNQPAKKMSREEILRQNRALNEQRLKAMNTKG